jgi:hypothetical protein
MQPYLLANSLTGIYAGDLCVLTTGGAFTGTAPNNPPVIRQLAAGDLPAVTNGILGVFPENLTTNASGQIIGRPTYGLTLPPGVIFSMPSPSARFPVETISARHRVPVILAAAANLFKARVVTTYPNAVDHRLDNVKANVVIVAVGGINYYFLDPAAATPTHVEIIKPDETDPNYGVVGAGGIVFFQFLPGVSQSLLGTNYTT